MFGTGVVCARSQFPSCAAPFTSQPWNNLFDGHMKQREDRAN